jgi:hypothetical protein
MGAWKKMLVHVAWSGLFLSGFLSTTLPVVAQQAVAETRGPQAADSQPLVAKTEPAAIELPDSPGTTATKSEESAQTQNSTSAPAAPPTQSQPQASPSAPPQRPVGTAAAEAPNASGIAASQPAGVAIAPAKQHRVRTIVLRMGAIVGAGVAVGSVVALTAATPSKPPGAH